MRYVDTSGLVAALTNENHTARVQHWLAAGGMDDLAISEWVIAEFSSALSLKLRVRSIDMAVRDAALDALNIMITQSLVLLPVTSAHFRDAARFADQHRLGLRAPDALHIAIAGEQGAILCTMDKRLANGGKMLGVTTRLV